MTPPGVCHSSDTIWSQAHAQPRATLALALCPTPSSSPREDSGLSVNRAGNSRNQGPLWALYQAVDSHPYCSPLPGLEGTSPDSAPQCRNSAAKSSGICTRWPGPQLPLHQQGYWKLILYLRFWTRTFARYVFFLHGPWPKK